MAFVLVMEDVNLVDDSTATGGTAFAGETLAEFILSMDNENGTPQVYDLNTINNLLEENGIEPISERQIMLKVVG